MARFPMPASKVAALGRILAEAAVNPAQRQALIDDPKTVLAAAGLPAELTSLFDFKVVCDSENARHIVLPFRYNTDKVRHGDNGYLSEIGKGTLGTHGHSARPN